MRRRPPNGIALWQWERDELERLVREMPRGLGDLGRFSPLVRVQIEQLACCEPAGVGLQMTHWSTRTLAKAAQQRDIVPHIARSTVSLILREATLQPHPWRCWKTPTLNAAFVERASKILWCYEEMSRLAERGELVLCFDEKPNLQALERRLPKQGMRPGQVEREEFEYIRHGAVNFASALSVADGQMRGWCLEKNDSERLRPVLEEMFDEFKEAKKTHLIWDGGSSHVSQKTRDFLAGYRSWVRALLTPAHASWLNQGELLLRAFSERYLERGGWNSRQALVDHWDHAWREYNHRFAHPFTWSWTRRDMRQWVNKLTR